MLGFVSINPFTTQILLLTLACSRMCFISHRLQLGLVLNYEQQKTIILGDLLSSAIHREQPKQPTNRNV